MAERVTGWQFSSVEEETLRSALWHYVDHAQARRSSETAPDRILHWYDEGRRAAGLLTQLEANS